VAAVLPGSVGANVATPGCSRRSDLAGCPAPDLRCPRPSRRRRPALLPTPLSVARSGDRQVDARVVFGSALAWYATPEWTRRKFSRKEGERESMWVTAGFDVCWVVSPSLYVVSLTGEKTGARDSLAFVLAPSFLRRFRSASPITTPRRWHARDRQVGARVLFGSAPAWYASRVDPAEILKEGGSAAGFDVCWWLANTLWL
jgi:hypothetical protein